MSNRPRPRPPTWLQSLQGPPPLRLETERLILRAFTLSDWQSVSVYRRDPVVLRYLDRTTPYSDLEIRAMLFAAAVFERHIRPRIVWDFALVIRHSQELIGECGLSLTENPGEAHLGYLLRQDCWGRGYTTEAAGAVLEFGFENLRLLRVTAGCHPENCASVRVLEKLGMRSLGLAEGFPGSPAGVDALVMSISAEEWRTRQVSCSTAPSIPPEPVAWIRPRPR